MHRRPSQLRTRFFTRRRAIDAEERAQPAKVTPGLVRVHGHDWYIESPPDDCRDLSRRHALVMHAVIS